MSFMQCEDIHVYYEIKGSGFPVLLIGGLGGGSWSWSRQVPFFADAYQSIVFDNRGAGRTDAPTGPYSMEQMAIDTVRLLHGLNVEKTFVVGLSMGGMIAQELAMLLSHRIKALVLGCTHSGGGLQIKAEDWVYEQLLSNHGLSQDEIIDKNIPLLFSQATRENRPEILDAYRRQQLESPVQPEHAFQAQYQAIQGFDFSTRLSKMPVPTLVITGSEDILVPPDNSRIMAETMPVAEFKELPETGHALHMEQTEAFNQAVMGFFQRHSL